jgi:hypothetical protein
MNEIWKTIKDRPNHEVSTLGNVRSKLTGKTMRPVNDGQGYWMVCLCYEGKGKTYRIHRLVMRTFVGEYPKGFFINHKNGVKTDNQLENLEYVTPKENIRHAIGLGLHSTGKLSADDVRQIHRLLADGRKGVDIAKLFSISPQQVSHIKRGDCWTDIGYEIL